MSSETHSPLTRCAWVSDDPLYQAYHDEEWGVPVHDEHALFECLTLEGAQAGLSWLTILRKREGYRRAFAGFDPEKVAQFTAGDIENLLLDPGIVRHRGKISATVDNARVWLALRAREGQVATWLWQFVGGSVRHNHYQTLADIPSESAESRAMSRALRAAGMRFVGPTTCYAFMQATGMVNDHLCTCFRSTKPSR